MLVNFLFHFNTSVICFYIAFIIYKFNLMSMSYAIVLMSYSIIYVIL